MHRIQQQWSVLAVHSHPMGDTDTTHFGVDRSGDVWKLELVEIPNKGTFQDEVSAHRMFEPYDAMSRRLPDYDRELDAEMAQAYLTGESWYRFTLRSGQNKRQFVADFAEMVWRRLNHDAVGILRLTAAAQGMTLRRHVALAARVPH